MTVLQTGQLVSLGHLLHMTRCMQGSMMVLLMLYQHTTHRSSLRRYSFTRVRVCRHFSSTSLSCYLVMFLSSSLWPSSSSDAYQVLPFSSWLATRIKALHSLASFSSTSCASSFSVAIQSSICLSDSKRITCSDSTLTSQSASLSLRLAILLLSQAYWLLVQCFYGPALTLMLMGNLNLSKWYPISYCNDSRLISLVHTWWPFDFIFSYTLIPIYLITHPYTYIPQSIQYCHYHNASPKWQVQTKLVNNLQGWSLLFVHILLRITKYNHFLSWGPANPNSPRNCHPPTSHPRIITTSSLTKSTLLRPRNHLLLFHITSTRRSYGMEWKWHRPTIYPSPVPPTNPPSEPTIATGWCTLP